MEVGTTFFTGLTEAEIAGAVDSLERRSFAAGTVLMAEGDIPGEMYVLKTGSAEVLVEDHTGAKQMVSRVGPGETIGEISLLTKQPASATVRIAEDCEVLVLAESKLAELTERFPGLERNMLRILATRLVRANRLAVGRQPGRLTVVDDRGAPPLLGFALAASVAWHTRARTLHVVLADSLPEELAALARARAEAHAQGGGPGAELVAGSPQREFGPERIESTLIRLAEDYDDVVVQLGGAASEGIANVAHTIRLASSEAPTAGFAVELASDAAAPFLQGPVLRSPPLSAEDELALEHGLLPTATGAGKALGRLARKLVGLEVGVALGTGSMRGYAHLGVLRELERKGIPVDFLAGTSIGAVVAGAYSLLGGVDEAAEFMDELGSKMFRPTVSRRSMLSTGAMRRHIRKRFDDPNLESAPIPLAVVATDVDTHEEVVLSRGSTTAALFASSAIPGVFPAVRIGSRTLVDGGIVNPVPASVAASLGAGVVIAVRLVSGGGIGEEVSEEVKGPVPNVVAAIVRSIETVQTRIKAETGSVPVVVIAPELELISPGRLRKFREGRRFMPAGEAAVESAMPRLRAVMPWLNEP
jgi:predicted acylesterase/phospholipase RssA/CRP-like cAMP-binding protein